MTREPTGHPEADGARGPSRPPRPRPTRAATGPIPPDPWSGTAPGFEFEDRRSRPGRGPERPRPNQPIQPGRDQDPRGRPGRPQSRDTPPPDEPRRYRYTPTVSQPLSAPPQAWLDDELLATPGYEFDDQPQNVAPARVIPLTRETGPRQADPRQADPRQADPRQGRVRLPRLRLARARSARVGRRRPGRICGRPAPSGPGCCARCCPSRPNAGGRGSSGPGSTSGAGGSGSRSPSSPWSSSVSPWS